MALAMTRALSVAAPDIAWVNCLNICFISGSLITPPAAGADVHVRDLASERAAAGDHRDVAREPAVSTDHRDAERVPVGRDMAGGQAARDVVSQRLGDAVDVRL
jgi:hypothetical protein